MDWVPSVLRWLFDSRRGAPERLISRWLFLRALGCIYFSAFFSLVFQIRGLIGPDGILPADEYLKAVAHSFGYSRGLWFAPTLLWLSSGPPVLGGHGRGAAVDAECLAARNAGDLFRLLSFVRERGAGFFRLPVRWDVA